MSVKPSKLDEIKSKVISGGSSGVHAGFLTPAEPAQPSTSTSADNENEYVNVDVPVRKKKPKFEDTHKRKTFWLQNDVFELVDEAMKNNDRGEMTYVINTLLREYFAKRKQ